MKSAKTFGWNAPPIGAERKSSAEDEARLKAANTHSLRLLVWTFGFAFSAMVWIEVGKAIVHLV